MAGKLYGIGAGPGDPELLTLKAINAIKNCDVIAAPTTRGGEGAALSIVAEYIGGKEMLECRFTMEKNITGRIAARQKAASDILRLLDLDKSVGYVTLGDPTTYSTYMYIHEIIAGKGYDAEIIPGITSYSAAAAAFGIPLCSGGETLTLIPAGYGDGIGDLPDYPGNKVIMKSGEKLIRTLEELKERGYGDHTKIACQVAMNGQRLYGCIDEFFESPQTGYFTLAIVKGKSRGEAVE